jgi:hypothetical protein
MAAAGAPWSLKQYISEVKDRLRAVFFLTKPKDWLLIGWYQADPASCTPARRT